MEGVAHYKYGGFTFRVLLRACYARSGDGFSGDSFGNLVRAKFPLEIKSGGY